MMAGVCADFVAPACGGHGVPAIPVGRGELVRAHLGFVPTEASLSYEPGEGISLPPKRVLEWHTWRAGAFSRSPCAFPAAAPATSDAASPP